MKKLLFGSIIFGFLFMLFLGTQIVPKPTEKNTYVEFYQVQMIHSPCCKDVVFQLRGDDHINYINRGLEQGIKPEVWDSQLTDQLVRFTFIRHKGLFGPKHRTIAKIEFKNETLYNAFS